VVSYKRSVDGRTPVGTPRACKGFRKTCEAAKKIMRVDFEHSVNLFVNSYCISGSQNAIFVNTHTGKMKLNFKYFKAVNLVLYWLQVFFALLSIGLFIAYFYNDSGYKLFFSIFFMGASYHCMMLIHLYKKELIKGITESSNGGPWAGVNRKPCKQHYYKTTNHRVSIKESQEIRWCVKCGFSRKLSNEIK